MVKDIPGSRCIPSNGSGVLIRVGAKFKEIYKKNKRASKDKNLKVK